MFRQRLTAPDPRDLRGSGAHDELVLEAPRRHRLAAFAAPPDEPGGTRIVILPDIRGLYRFYEELALRFAERGHAAIAIDYFGRTAGVSKRDDDFEWQPHVQQTTAEGVQADAAAAVAPGSARRRTSIFTVGFCFGGRHSWLAAAGATGSPARSASTAGPTEAQRLPGPAQRAGEFEARSSGYGRRRRGHPVEQVTAFEQALADAGVEHELVVYDGAPHSFFDRKQEDFAEASADAWNRVLAFIGP